HGQAAAPRPPCPEPRSEGLREPRGPAEGPGKELFAHSSPALDPGKSGRELRFAPAWFWMPCCPRASRGRLCWHTTVPHAGGRSPMTVGPGPLPRAARDNLPRKFLALLPRIELHARITFRSVRCPDRRADAIAETVALAWQWHVRLAERGKDVRQFPAAFAALAARAVRSGRRLCGHEKCKDVCSPVAQRQHGFQVAYLPPSTRSAHEHLYATPQGQVLLDAFEERLRDNTLTPVPDQVAFRMDFPAWLRTLTPRDRDLRPKAGFLRVCALAVG